MIYKLIFENGYDEEPIRKVALKKSFFGRNEQFAYWYYDDEGKGHNEFNLSLKVNNTNSLEITSQQITSMSGTEVHHSDEKPEVTILTGKEINKYFDKKMIQHEIYGHTIWDSDRHIVKIVWEEGN